ncbi:MAG: tRNA lysidine(34) synthetase TilS [Hyphomicrobiaceae bacterium]
MATRFAQLRTFDHVLLAISGGSDSTALMCLVADWAANPDISSPDVTAITVDHRLRPESTLEAAQVASNARALQLPHRILEWTGSKPSSGLQVAARRARYQLITNYAKRLRGKSVIVTAHTLEDQAETVLMRLGRGSGPDGLAGIPEKGSYDEIALLRPLLSISGRTLLSYLKSKDISWIDDPSNHSEQFERVRIRKAHDARTNLGLSNKALARTAKRMARAKKALDIGAQSLLKTLLVDQKWLLYGAIIWKPSRINFSEELSIRALRSILRTCGGNREYPELGQVEDLQCTLSSRRFAGATLAGCRLINISNDSDPTVLICREPSRISTEPTPVLPNQDTVWDHRFVIRCDDVSPALTVTKCDPNIDAPLLRKSNDAFYHIPSEILASLPIVRSGESPVLAPNNAWQDFGGQLTLRFMTDRFTISAETCVHFGQINS